MNLVRDTLIWIRREDIYFQVSNNEKVWHAEYTMKMSNKGRIRFKVIRGWRKFSKDNNLEVGDVCNFEVILSTNMTFHVHVFKSSEFNSHEFTISK